MQHQVILQASPLFYPGPKLSRPRSHLQDYPRHVFPSAAQHHGVDEISKRHTLRRNFQNSICDIRILYTPMVLLQIDEQARECTIRPHELIQDEDLRSPYVYRSVTNRVAVLISRQRHM